MADKWWVSAFPSSLANAWGLKENAKVVDDPPELPQDTYTSRESDAYQQKNVFAEGIVTHINISRRRMSKSYILFMRKLNSFYENWKGFCVRTICVYAFYKYTGKM